MNNKAQIKDSSEKSSSSRFNDNAKDEADSMSGRLQNFFHHAGDNVVQAKKTVTTQLRTKPIQSSLIALGAGFIIGTLMRR